MMRSLLLGLFAVVAISSLARGAAASPIGAREAGLYPETVALLAKADQDRVWAAYHKMLADNPDLKKELDKLLANERASTSLTGLAIVEKTRSYRIKCRQTMLKEDPSIAPLLTHIDELVSAMRAQRQGEADAAKP
jgi:hypothetical protein